MQVTYILLRIATDLISILSRAINAFIFGGSTAQTLSARSHLEAPRSAVWARRRNIINGLFFWQPDHCRWAWEKEVERARSYPLVTLISDSFWEGTGSETGDIESIVMARALGFNAALAAVGSTGLINPGGNNTSGYPKVAWTHAERLKDLTLSGVTSAQAGSAVSPAMGVVAASLNDGGVSSGTWGAFGATLTDAIVNRADVLIDAWIAAHPGKPLVWFGPMWPSGQPNNRPTLDIYRIRDGVQRACAARRSQNVHFIDRLMPPLREGVYTTTTDQAYLYTGGTSGTDPTHPTPDGHRFDGLWMADQLRRLILREFN